MKVLFVDTYYPSFLAGFYERTDSRGLGYEAQRRALLDERFGLSDAYSHYLAPHGVEATEVIANAAPLQLRWAREAGMRGYGAASRLPPTWTGSALAGKTLDATGALVPIVVEQVRRMRPDVLYMHDLSLLPPQVLRSLKDVTRLVVGQIACPLPPADHLAPYDLILTSFPHYVPRLRERGLRAEYFRIGFDPRVLDRIGEQPRRWACTFVGGISAAHARGTAFLERLARDAAVDFFGYGVETLAAGSPIRPRHHGPVWALDMYRTLAQSQVTVNRHIDVAEGYANNMRLYEATGVGAMLLTDRKINLGELFEPGVEVAAYDGPDEAVEQIRYYAEHPEARDAIARAGQRRTLRDHTYAVRMGELASILGRHLGGYG